jgi:haloalkane dehalogenase
MPWSRRRRADSVSAVPQVTLERDDGIAYRQTHPAGSPKGAPVLCLHGWPQSSYMWRHLLPALGSAGRRALAPDLLGFGDSAPDPPATWERHVEAIERFHDAVVREPMRTPLQGEALVDSLSRDGLGTLLQESAKGIDEPAVDEYWKAFSSPESRRGMLELYRSFDLDSLKPYEGRLAALGVPTLILWGEQDDFLPADYASRFAGEIPGSELVSLAGTRHFLFEDEPERCAQEIIGFLERAAI